MDCIYFNEVLKIIILTNFSEVLDIILIEKKKLFKLIEFNTIRFFISLKSIIVEHQCNNVVYLIIGSVCYKIQNLHSTIEFVVKSGRGS